MRESLTHTSCFLFFRIAKHYMCKINHLALFRVCIDGRQKQKIEHTLPLLVAGSVEAPVGEELKRRDDELPRHGRRAILVSTGRRSAGLARLPCLWQHRWTDLRFVEVMVNTGGASLGPGGPWPLLANENSHYVNSKMTTVHYCRKRVAPPSFV